MRALFQDRQNRETNKRWSVSAGTMQSQIVTLASGSGIPRLQDVSSRFA
jgi:hypothetical protein